MQEWQETTDHPDDFTDSTDSNTRSSSSVLSASSERSVVLLVFTLFAVVLSAFPFWDARRHYNTTTYRTTSERCSESDTNGALDFGMDRDRNYCARHRLRQSRVHI